MLKLIHFLPLLFELTSCRRNYSGWNVYRVSPTKNQEYKMEFIMSDSRFDFWKKTSGAPLIVSVNPSGERDFFQYLHENKIKYTVHIRDLGSFLEDLESPFTTRILQNRGTGANLFDNYLSHAEMNHYLDSLAKKYPSLVTVSTFGYSYEKRKIKMVKITNSTYKFQKPIIFIDAGIHAREWLAPAMALYIINQLAENETNLYLTNSVEWHIVPLLNPDGYEYSYSEDVMWRKTRSPTGIHSCPGVDGNRNFDFHWMESGSSNDPCIEIFAGEKPFSEAETRAVRDYMLRFQGQISLYLTFHSFGSVILYPYSYKAVEPKNHKELAKIARKANEANLEAGGVNFDIGSGATTMYLSSGGSDDWAMGVAGVPLAYTIELPPDTFHPKAAEIKKLVTPVFEAVRVFGQHLARSDIISRKPVRSGCKSMSVKKEKWNFLAIYLTIRLTFYNIFNVLSIF